VPTLGIPHDEALHIHISSTSFKLPSTANPLNSSQTRRILQSSSEATATSTEIPLISAASSAHRCVHRSTTVSHVTATTATTSMATAGQQGCAATKASRPSYVTFPGGMPEMALIDSEVAAKSGVSTEHALAGGEGADEVCVARGEFVPVSRI
ncbi:hypothetical protein CIB48_g7491, partial [Xylaria polymorpha]